MTDSGVRRRVPNRREGQASLTRRGGAVGLGLVGALLIGGVSQAFFWRWGLDGVSAVTDSQFMWVLLTFAVAWAWAEGSVVEGAAAGGVTGLALISSYYVVQWLAEGEHSAAAQFSKSGGAAWTLAAVAGGAVMGLFGALAGMDATARPRLKALGLTTPAVIVGVGPAAWLVVNGHYLASARLLPAVVVFAAAAVALLVRAVRTCGLAAAVQALAISLAVAATALAALWWLQTHGGLYRTF